MIGKTSIIQNLGEIEALYNKSTSTKKALFNSKLAILELCGWIEESMDDIIKRYASRNLMLRENKEYVNNEIIKKVYGFDYNRNFRRMLMQTIGLANLEKIEKRVNPVKFQKMKTSLSALKACRDNEAHTHIKGVTRRLDAPSVTKIRFHDVYEGLKDFEEQLKRI